MSKGARVVQKLHPGVTSEQARDARARAWSFVFECYQNNKAARAIRGEGGADLDRRVRTSKGVKPETS